MPEKVLPYDRGIVAQEQYWDCGPASAQIILDAAGINKSEDWLIRQIGTTTAGTNHTGLITPILNDLLPGSGYKVVWITKEPVPKTQVEKLWSDIKRSIDADRGTLLNFVAPPWNFPKPSYTSTQPLAYRGNSTIYHYLAGMGWAVDNSGGRHIWLADPGFAPHGMWCRLEQVATLIVPHSYGYAADAPIVTKPVPVNPKPIPAPTNPLEEANFLRTDIEWRATQYGDPDAVAAIVRFATQDNRGKAALALLERVNPAALQAFITKG